MVRHYYDDGFTIVELLIVIVVIAILAAISIVAYTGIQDRTNNAAVASDLRNMAAKVYEVKVTSADDQFPLATQASLEAFAMATKSAYYSGASGTFAYCRDDASFALAARSKSGDRYLITSGSGTVVKNSFSWTGNLASLCGIFGYPSAAPNPGQGTIWFRDSVGWRSWVKG